MVKKIILCVLCVAFALSVCVFAEETATNENIDAPTTQGEMPEPGQGRGQMPGRQRPQDGMDRPQMEWDASGENLQPPQMPEGGMQPPQMQDGSADTQPPEIPGDGTEQTENSQQPQTSDNPFAQGGMQRPSDFQNETANTQGGTAAHLTLTEVVKEYFTPIISMVLLALTFVFVIFYKRKRY